MKPTLESVIKFAHYNNCANLSYTTVIAIMEIAFKSGIEGCDCRFPANTVDCINGMYYDYSDLPY